MLNFPFAMETVLTKDPGEAAAFIRRGGVVAFPSETVYGLGANVFDERAVTRIFAAKRRPADNPLIAHIAELEHIADLVEYVTPSAAKLIDAFFPGPVTVVLKKGSRVPLIATAGLDTIGVRMPRLALAHEFIHACESPVAAPSANLSGRPSPTTWQSVSEDLNGRIDCILQGDATDIGLESTVVDCTRAVTVLLRKGAVSIDELRRVIPEIELHDATTPGPARSPGLLHKHYSPQAKVVIAREPAHESDAFIGLHEPASKVWLSRICGDVGEYARVVFEFFRECDRRGVETIVCEPVEESGLGSALMDRLRRAAE